MKTGKKIYLSQAQPSIPNDKIIVFWDTCALIDIIRIPCRDNLAINDLVCYEGIADYIEAGEVISVTSGLVIKEFEDHFDEEHAKLIQTQRKIIDKVNDYLEFMISPRKKDKIRSAINSLNLEHRLVSVLSKILRKTVILKEQNIYRNFADYRLRNKMAPAARKSEYKDCYIWGTFIELIHNINPVSPYVSFITVNSKDYTDITNRNILHSHIITDCNFLPSMHISLSIGHLYGDLHRILGH